MNKRETNSGNYNSGNYNSGDYNSGSHNSGHFNTNEPTVRLFNKDTGLTRDQIKLPYINIKVTEWVPESKMTDAQKIANPSFSVTQGILINRSYKEAWALAWAGASTELKNMFLNLPGFDAEIFEEITGVKVNAEPTCDGKVVEIDGKKYKLQEVK